MLPGLSLVVLFRAGDPDSGPARALAAANKGGAGVALVAVALAPSSSAAASEVPPELAETELGALMTTTPTSAAATTSATPTSAAATPIEVDVGLDPRGDSSRGLGLSDADLPAAFVLATGGSAAPRCLLWAGGELAASTDATAALVGAAAATMADAAQRGARAPPPLPPGWQPPPPRPRWTVARGFGGVSAAESAGA